MYPVAWSLLLAHLDVDLVDDLADATNTTFASLGLDWASIGVGRRIQPLLVHKLDQLGVNLVVAKNTTSCTVAHGNERSIRQRVACIPLLSRRLIVMRAIHE